MSKKYVGRRSSIRGALEYRNGPTHSRSARLSRRRRPSGYGGGRPQLLRQFGLSFLTCGKRITAQNLSFQVGYTVLWISR